MPKHRVNPLSLSLSLCGFDGSSSDDLSTMIHLQPALRFNGGGHINHAIFWQVLSPKEGGNQPNGALADQIKKDFGSFDKMVTQLSNASVGVQGSGWGWLGFDKQGQRLQVATCSNQDPLQATTGKRERDEQSVDECPFRSYSHLWY